WKASKDGGKLAFLSVDATISKQLNPIGERQRPTDIFLGRPRKLTRRIRMVMPRNWTGSGWSNHLEAPGLRLSSSLSIGKRTIEHSKELAVEAWTVPGTDILAYNEVVKKAEENQLTIWSRGRYGAVWPPTRGGLPLGLPQSVITAFWLIFLMLLILS